MVILFDICTYVNNIPVRGCFGSVAWENAWSTSKIGSWDSLRDTRKHWTDKIRSRSIMEKITSHRNESGLGEVYRFGYYLNWMWLVLAELVIWQILLALLTVASCGCFVRICRHTYYQMEKNNKNWTQFNLYITISYQRISDCIYITLRP